MRNRIGFSTAKKKPRRVAARPGQGATSSLPWAGGLWAWRGSHQKALLVHSRESLVGKRLAAGVFLYLLSCLWCRKLFAICSSCYRGHRYAPVDTQNRPLMDT